MGKCRKIIGQSFMKLFIAAIFILNLYPFLWLFLSSLKKDYEYARPMYMLPEGLYFQNYVNAIKVSNVGLMFKNTVIVTFVSILAAWILSVTLAFGVTRMKWRFSKAVLLYVQIGMFIPPFVLLLPLFLTLQSLGVLNTLFGLIIVFGSGISMPVYLLSGFYRYVPAEIMEASVIDGCNIYKMFFKIVMPMSLNGYITVIILIFTGIWNDLLISQTFVSSNSKRMLQAGLVMFLDAWGGRDWGSTFAVICISIFPTVALYLLLNNKIIDGLAAGAVKG